MAGRGKHGGGEMARGGSCGVMPACLTCWHGALVESGLKGRRWSAERVLHRRAQMPFLCPFA